MYLVNIRNCVYPLPILRTYQIVELSPKECIEITPVCQEEIDFYKQYESEGILIQSDIPEGYTLKNVNIRRPKSLQRQPSVEIGVPVVLVKPNDQIENNETDQTPDGDLGGDNSDKEETPPNESDNTRDQIPDGGNQSDEDKSQNSPTELTDDEIRSKLLEFSDEDLRKIVVEDLQINTRATSKYTLVEKIFENRETSIQYLKDHKIV